VSPSGPVSTLFLVIVGALAIAGLLAGAIYRFGSARRGDRQDFDNAQRAPWDAIDVGATIRSPPLATQTPTPQTGPAHRGHEAVIPDEIVQLLSRLSKEAAA
jgi:ABC-type phosphate/phosphonate transport system permease subunit